MQQQEQCAGSSGQDTVSQAHVLTVFAPNHTDSCAGGQGRNAAARRGRTGRICTTLPAGRWGWADVRRSTAEAFRPSAPAPDRLGGSRSGPARAQRSSEQLHVYAQPAPERHCFDPTAKSA